MLRSFQKLCMEGLSTLRNACMGGLLNFLTYCIVRSYVLKPRIKRKKEVDYVLGMACSEPTFT